MADTLKAVKYEFNEWGNDIKPGEYTPAALLRCCYCWAHYIVTGFTNGGIRKLGWTATPEGWRCAECNPEAANAPTDSD